MVRGKDTNGMVMLLLFVAATFANAAPKLGGNDISFVSSDSSSNLCVYAFISSEINPITGLCNPNLAAIASEFHKPPVSFVGSSPQADRIKLLPPVPGTLLMVLVGFLCVSFVKDRRFWLTTLTGLLWAGQAGFIVLPHLASHLAGKKQIEQKFSADVARLSEPKHPCRLRSDIEGTPYIGLLHHLAGIPGDVVPFLPRIGVRDKLKHEYKKNTAQSCYLSEYFNTSAQRLCNHTLFAIFESRLNKRNHYFDRAHQLAITGSSACIIRETDCIALRAVQLIYFTPAFITANLARGPPNIIQIFYLLLYLED